MTNEQFTALAKRYTDTVFRVAYNYIKSRADAEDVTQNVFEKLLKFKAPFHTEELLRYNHQGDNSSFCNGWPGRN